MTRADWILAAFAAILILLMPALVDMAEHAGRRAAAEAPFRKHGVLP